MKISGKIPVITLVGLNKVKCSTDLQKDQHLKIKLDRKSFLKNHQTVKDNHFCVPLKKVNLSLLYIGENGSNYRTKHMLYEDIKILKVV